MAGRQPSCISIISTFLLSMALTGILQLILVVSALADRCTRAVPVQKHAPKKMHMLRRVPSGCSNWEKTWSFLWSKDCGTKYRLDYVTVPSSDVQYKLEFVCCDGDTDCEESENIHSSGFDSTDEKFLAIVLGSAAAAVIIIIVIVAISLCTRKRRCLSARENGHAYDRAEAEDRDVANVVEAKLCQEDRTSDEECRPSEPVYAEIGDSTLPRYTDLFKQTETSAPDPFKHATAPPINGNAAVANSGTQPVRHSQMGAANNRKPGDVAASNRAATGVASSRDEDKYASVTKSTKTLEQFNSNGDVTETRYYNVREKKKKKKKSGRPARDKAATVDDKDAGAGGVTATVHSTKRVKINAPGTVEMMVKSSSTSETMAAHSHPKETCLTQQKRRSAPPDSPELRIIGGNSPRQAQIVASRPTVPSSLAERTLEPICTVHQKPQKSPISSSHNLQTSSEAVRKTSTSSKNQRKVGEKRGGGGGAVGGVGVHKSCIKNSAAIKSPASLDGNALPNKRQSYENIPEKNLPNSNDPPKKIKKIKKKVKEKVSDTPHASHALHLYNDQEESHLDEASFIHLPPPLQFAPGNDEMDQPLHREEAENVVSPLLSRPEGDTNKLSPSQDDSSLDLSCASPLLNEHQSYLSSIPSSHSGIGSEGAWSPTSGRGCEDYDTLQYTYDPSVDEHLYQRLDRGETSSLPKC